MYVSWSFYLRWSNYLDNEWSQPPNFVAFLQSHEQVYCLHSWVHNSRKKQLYTYLATLGATFIGLRVWQGIGTQFEEKPAALLPWQRRTLGTAFISYRVQHGLYTILGKTSHTLIRLAKACLCTSTSTYCDSICTQF